mmetsp:Transcript_6197/g.8011  ORF Transcript_6197/g.8011 Transcript_6197/m.8011 type:complete len:142 (+) Transcript_6197:1189-1614(+)
MKYAMLSVPVDLTSTVLSTIALESLMTHIVPKSELGSALAVIDVLHSVVGVFAPMMAGLIVQYLGLLAKPLITGIALVLLFIFAFYSMPPPPPPPRSTTSLNDPNKQIKTPITDDESIIDSLNENELIENEKGSLLRKKEL